MVHQPLFLLIYLYHEVISESKQNVIRSVGYTSNVAGRENQRSKHGTGAQGRALRVRLPDLL